MGGAEKAAEGYRGQDTWLSENAEFHRRFLECGSPLPLGGGNKKIMLGECGNFVISAMLQSTQESNAEREGARANVDNHA